MILTRRLAAVLCTEKRKLNTQNTQLGSILTYYCQFHLKFPDSLLSVDFVTYSTKLTELNHPENRHGAWRNTASVNPQLMSHYSALKHVKAKQLICDPMPSAKPHYSSDVSRTISYIYK